MVNGLPVTLTVASTSGIGIRAIRLLVVRKMILEGSVMEGTKSEENGSPQRERCGLVTNIFRYRHHESLSRLDDVGIGYMGGKLAEDMDGGVANVWDQGFVGITAGIARTRKDVDGFDVDGLLLLEDYLPKHDSDRVVGQISIAARAV